MTAPSRRWFRFAFTLRTLFVVVTVLGCWLGYELNWIRQRHQFLEMNDVQLESINQGFYVNRPAPWRSAPGLLWLFGETGYPEMHVWVGRDDPEQLGTADHQHIQEAKQNFPEALVSLINSSADGSSIKSFSPP